MALTKVSIPLIKSLGSGDPGQVLTAQNNGEFNWVYQTDLSAGSADYATEAGTAGYAGSAGHADSATSAVSASSAYSASIATVASSANSVYGGNVSGQVAFAATANAVAGANVSGTVALANKVANSNQSNITQLGNLVSLSVAGDTTLYGNLDVKGNVNYIESNVVAINDINITIGNGAANATQADGGGITLEGANAQITYLASNDGWNFNKQVVANVTGDLTGTATNADLATYATTANAVAGANVTGTVANATYAVTAGTAYSVAAGNITGTVSFATNSTTANIANEVDGANVTGTVANATYATSAGSATTANGVAAANITGTINYATYAGTANSVAAANIIGTVANATYATSAGSADSVALANVTGIGNIANINLNGNGSQALLGNGAWGNVSGSSGTTISAWALANSYSNGALVINNNTIWQAQSNIAANTAFVSGNVANTWLALTSGISLKVETFTATAGQTTFTASIAPSGSVEFNINGILVNANAVSVSNTTVTYTAANNGAYALRAGDLVTITYTYGTNNSSMANLTVTGTSNLGAVGNVTITGGSNGQVLVTNGSGTLTWGNAAPTVSMKVQEIVANASQTSFTLTTTPLGTATMAINGSTIRPSAVSVSGNTVTYTAANNYSYTIEANDSVIFTYISSS